ncbi:putative P-type ATPase, A domain superfamily [Helianthus annuus]|nr:putative P-type ATPase, A domain superfamily [Helianthus annuus]
MLMVYRCGKWTKIAGTDLLPGDVVLVGRAAGQDREEKSVPADMLILAGTTIVNEAILTDESTPQWKWILILDGWIFEKIPRDLTEASLSGAGLSIIAALAMMFLFGMFLAAFIENHGKTNAFDEDVTKLSFIVDDTNGETQDDDITSEDGESDDDDDHFDSVCAICDNVVKGDVLGRFTQSQILKRHESNCESLCLSLEELESQNEYKCENCQYSLHQYFVCGELGSSDKSSNTEVFRCSSATCGHFYHPKCVAKQLQKNDKTERQKLQEKIAAG